MAMLDTLNEKVAAAREAGRDVPPVLEELFQLIAAEFDKSATPAPAKAATPALAPSAPDPSGAAQ